MALTKCQIILGSCSISKGKTFNSDIPKNVKSDILSNRELAVLRGFPNVTVSHHMAFYTDECVNTVVRDSLMGCKCFVEGKENPWVCA